MSQVDILAARVRALQAKVNEAEGFADACRAASAHLHGPLGRLSGVSIDVSGMRSRSTAVARARADAESARSAVDSVRSRLSDAVSNLDGIGRTYQRRADSARADLRAAAFQLAVARATGTG